MKIKEIRKMEEINPNIKGPCKIDRLIEDKPRLTGSCSNVGEYLFITDCGNFVICDVHYKVFMSFQDAVKDFGKN